MSCQTVLLTFYRSWLRNGAEPSRVELSWAELRCYPCPAHWESTNKQTPRHSSGKINTWPAAQAEQQINGQARLKIEPWATAAPTDKKQIRKLQRLTKLLKLFPFFTWFYFLYFYLLATLCPRGWPKLSGDSRFSSRAACAACPFRARDLASHWTSCYTKLTYCVQVESLELRVLVFGVLLSAALLSLLCWLPKTWVNFQLVLSMPIFCACLFCLLPGPTKLSDQLSAALSTL